RRSASAGLRLTRSRGSTWRSQVSRPSSSTSRVSGSISRERTCPTIASSTRPCGGRGNEHGDDPRPGHRPPPAVGATEREPTKPVYGTLRPRAPPDLPESLGARDHVRSAVHVARVLREQLQRCLSGSRPVDV